MTTSHDTPKVISILDGSIIVEASLSLSLSLFKKVHHYMAYPWKLRIAMDTFLSHF